MHLKKAICFCLIRTAMLTAAAVFGRVEQGNRGVLKAEGGAPLPPPIPWVFTDAGKDLAAV